MAKTIRCILPDGVHRFEPFTVADYRDFIYIRLELEEHDLDEQAKILDEVTQDYFDLPESYRHYAFLRKFLASIGKTKFPILVTCPICGEEHQTIFTIEQDDLEEPVIQVSNIKLKFKFPDKDYDNLTNLVLDNIKEVENDGQIYNWADLPKDRQDVIISLIDMKTFEQIVRRLKPIYFTLRSKHCGKIHEVVFSNLLSIFKLLISPDEIFTYYQINHLLAKHGYDLTAVMNMIPAERGYALSLVDKDLS